MKAIIPILFTLFSFTAHGQQIEVEKIFPVKSARQAVAVDEKYFYVINNTEIVKYQKSSGEQVLSWKDNSGDLKHLNSGIIINGQLYCTHTNYNDIPMTSSIEVFDPENLEPIESHSFGIDIGSATWIDWYDGHWYVAFAHYNGGGGEPGKSNQWTQLVKFTKDWNRVGGWVFPADLIIKFGNASNSGGFFYEDKMYITGHDSKEVYQLALPKQGSTLKWLATIPAPFEGQGIAQDPDNPLLFYGIARSKNQVIRGYLNN